MGFFFYQAEAGSLVNAMRRSENALGPENHLAIAHGASETDALVHQGVPQAKPAGAGLDKQQAQLGGVWLGWMFHQEDVSYVMAIALGDPAAFAGRLKIGEKFGNDFGCQGFEAAVPSKLFGVAYGFSMDHPAHIPDTMGAKHE